MDFAMRITEDLRKKYDERRAQDAELLALSLDEGRFEVLARLGHQLKGNAATYGYEDLAQLGRKMEQAAEAHSLPEGKQCLYALRAWVQERAGVGEDG
jgi:HPt (histidine-containing phosphotransfer) domain-containing protein